MKFLKFLLWLIVPYIMVLLNWKKMGKVGRIVGSLWAVLAIFIVIVSNSSDKKSSTLSSVSTGTEQAQAVSTEPKKEEPKKEESKIPQWNTKDMNIEDNGNVPVAVKLLKTSGDIKMNAESPNPGDVAKAPWNFYGKVLKIRGQAAIVQEFPPGSDVAKSMGGAASEIVMASDDGTITDYLMAGSSGSIKVDDVVEVYGYPVGLEDVKNKMGGTTTQLVLVGNAANVAN